MHTLHITVAGKVATYSARDGSIICGNDDYQVQFALDSGWDGLKAKARFRWNGKHKDVPIVDGLAAVPRITNAHEVKVGVYSEDGSLKTTTAARVPCNKSILCGDSAPTEGNEAHYASEAQKAADRAEAAADRAEAAGGSGGGNTGGGVVIDPESVNQAQEAAQAALDSAEAAADSAQAAETAQGKAEGARDTAVANAEMASTSATVAAREAGNASKSSAAAATARTAAETAAGTATSAKTAAEAARDTASQKATEANEAAAAAQTAKGEAQTAATNAGKSATAAASSATTASNAATAAQTAQGKAETAQAAASQKATDATNAAQTATSKATEASQSATAAGTAKTAAEEAAARAEEAANRLLGVAVVGVIETVNGVPSIVLTSAQEVADYTAYFKVVDADGNETLAEIGKLVPKDDPETKTYTIQWLNYDGTVLETDTVKEGDTPTYDDATPTRAADSQYTYTFKGWDKTVEPATADATYTAVYEPTAFKPAYINLLTEAGYKKDYKISASNGSESASAGAYVSGFIPIKDVTHEFYIKGITLSSAASVNNIVFYDLDNKTKLTGAAGTAGAFNSNIHDRGNGLFTFSPSSWTGTANAAFFRFSCGGITDESIVTENEQP